MNRKTFSLLALVAVLAIAFAGCAQDSTDMTNENPEMQEAIDKGATAAAAGAAGAAGSTTDTTRSEPKGGTGGTKVALSADPTGALKYNTTQLNAKAGNIAIAFTNKSSTPHDVTVTGDGDKKIGATKEVTGGNAATELKDVKAGDYTFFCSVPGHEQAGMKGTLTVR